jgi:hypothetical protein
MGASGLVVVSAAGAMHMRCGGGSRNRDGGELGLGDWCYRGGCVRRVMRVVMVVVFPMAVPMSTVPMPARRVSAALGFERFIDRIHYQVHRAQHVGQHMVGLDFEVIGF